jgi:hypothetical protein
MILKRLMLALALVAGAALLGALLIAPASAQGLTKGSSVLSIQLAHGDADFASPVAGGYMSAYEHSEWGGQAMFQHLLSENWALALSAGIGTFSETNSPGTGAIPGAEEFEYTQSSFNVRAGFDRFVHLSPEFHLFAGPGIQYWTGKGETDDGVTTAERPSVTRIALSGRMGAHVALGDSFGLTGYVGGFIGRASADEDGAEASWTPSGHNGAMGVAFSF